MKPDRRAQVLELIKQKGEVGLKDVYTALEVTKVYAAVLLLNMTDAKLVTRSGYSRHYRYSLPAPVEVAA